MSMGDYRSNSYNYSDRGDTEIERYYGQTGPKRPNFEDNPPHNFRSYSVSYGNTSIPQTNLDIVVAGSGRDPKFKKGKSTNGSTSKSWTFTDPEFQRKKRIASYKAYSVEGKVKGSFRKSFRWLKDKYTHVVYGWW